MLRPDGTFICTDAGGKEVQFDSYLCGHCGLPKAVRPKHLDEDIGGFCRLCTKNICPRCLATGRCDPLEAQIERSEARGRALRSYGMA
ncbi:MAG: hypothetical protein MK097_09020 [Dechloromonas sp.]|nr:hypothetical protein [Dechloromonas sp.]